MKKCIFFLLIFFAISPDKVSSQKDFDIASVDVDVNGWYLNPKWTSQLNNPPTLPNPYNNSHFPTPTRTQYMWSNTTSWKCPNTAFKEVPYPGHFNFAGATFEGIVSWGSRSGNDDDYNIHLFPQDNSGLTAVNPDFIQMEFDSDETIDHFHTSWWDYFHHAVDNGTAGSLIDGKKVIAFGVLGLDCAHNCSSELHPVWALGIQVSADINTEEWAIFVRNWGNEGYCSSGVEAIDPSINSYTFKIKHPGAASVSVVSSEFLCRGKGGSGPYVQLIPDEGALVTFYFPPPDNRERINGILKLKWTTSRKIIYSKYTGHDSLLKKPWLALKVDKDGRNETNWHEMMTAEQKMIYQKNKMRNKLYYDSSPLVKTKRVFKPVTTLNNPKLIQSLPDKEREKKDQAERNALLKAYKGKLPELK